MPEDATEVSILDQAISPAAAVAALAARGIKISERTLREKARRIGAYRELGQAMFFLPEDIEKIMKPRTSVRKKRGSALAAEKRRQPNGGPHSPEIKPIMFRRNDR